MFAHLYMSAHPLTLMGVDKKKKKKSRAGHIFSKRTTDLSDAVATKRNVVLTSSTPLAPWEVVEPVMYREM